MRVAIVHQLPVELYPPVMNAASILGGRTGDEVRVWTSPEPEGMGAFSCAGVALERSGYPGAKVGAIRRLVGFLEWHFRVARQLAAWRPEVVLSIEPHSALGVWMYYRLFRGRARLLIHHHEYYSPADFRAKGNRTTRISHFFETMDLFRRAVWVSQTNSTRLRLMMEDLGMVGDERFHTWPNYPPAGWRNACEGPQGKAERGDEPLRLVCVGSLSFEDTFIREVVEWVVGQRGGVTLYVCGHNVRGDVWDWIDSLGCEFISMNREGVRYHELPGLLGGYDVALVLYRGNTLNFVHNVPNKVFEALVCGLCVWFPRQMEEMRVFCARHPELPLVEVDFEQLTEEFCPPMDMVGIESVRGFTAEAAMEPVLQLLDRGRVRWVGQ